MFDRLGYLLLASIVVSFAIANPAAEAKTAKHAPKSQAPNPETQVQQPAADDTALDNAKDAPPAPVLACSGSFDRASTHAKLAAAFGEKNIVLKQIEGTGARNEKVTVLFENEPIKQVVIRWRDAATRSGISSIEISAPSIWIGPGGIRNGLPLKEVEKLNGGTFTINGFESNDGGFASGLKDQFASPAGGCSLSVRFEPGIANPLPKKFAAIVGSKKVLSGDRLLRRAKPMVSEWSIRYN